MKPWYFNRMKKNGNEPVAKVSCDSRESGLSVSARVGMRNIPYRPVAGPSPFPGRFPGHFPGRFPGKGVGVGVGVGASREIPNQKPKFLERENQKEKETEKEISEEYKQKVCENSYLGVRGYTIPKSVLDKEEIQFLKKATTIKPKVSGPTFGPPGGMGAQDVKPYPYFRENDAKFFLPRMYGISRYGLPFETQLSFGREVGSSALDFASDKPLRDYQAHIIGTYLDHVRGQVLEFETETEDGGVGVEQTLYGGGGILEVPCGRGKCLGKDTPILMYDGTIKMVQDVLVGDIIMGDDSGPRKVLSLARGRENMYKIGCKKGDGYIVNESHILSLKYGTDMNRNIKKNTVLDISVTDYLNLPRYYHGRGGPLYGYRVPIVFPEQEVEMDPYLLGYWLGDGSSKGSLITTQEAVVIKYLVECFKTRHKTLYLKYTGYQYDYRINSTEPNSCDKSNFFMNFLRKNNLINNKHIPHHYKCNSRKNQLELLAGIIDSDGYYHDNCYEVVQKSEILLDDIVYLAHSLGFGAYKRKMIKTCTNNGVSGTYFSVNICGVGLEEIPVKCMRKKAHPRKLLRDCLKYRITVTPIGVDDYYGFEIDGNHRFVLGDYTVTHNTVMALKIISELKCPALIYVNKGFLADQWLERIATYLPNASVGRVQADTFDIENRDIVICMIQTIYNRDYVAKNEFKDFGITIIDEVHRIGSGEFSKALFNITTPYVLGISATVDRKDGMESVLKMFLGGMLYSDKRQDGDCVQIRCVEYADRDNEYYNKEEHDFRGNVKYSTMMSKICEHQKRTDFLYRLLCDLVAEYPENLSEEFPDACVGVKDLVVIEKQEPQVECPVCHGQVGLSKLVNISCKHSLCEKCLDDLEQPKCPTCKKRFTLVFSGTGDADGSKTHGKTSETKSEPKSEPKSETVLTEYPGQNQIIVLAQYREVLRELYARITEKGLTTVGYYVGGMKQKDLDISKTKQIILATYSMASEGLDVATLSTLVFATPRTDIKQSVGRILRQKHARNPIVVDVVDTHKTFKNQATKRRTYYRQNGYAIYKCGYEEYRDMTEVETRWKVAYHPSKAKVCKSDAVGAVGAAVGGVAGEEASDSDTDENKLAFDGICML